MPSIETLALFVAASLAIAIAPGPSNLYVLARTITHGRRAGLLSAGGLALGALVHSTAFQRALDWLSASVLIGLGLRIAATARPQ